VHEAVSSHAPRVFVLPPIEDGDMPAMYAGADALVLPSRGEGWGRPHVEAMAMGLALVATNWSGPTEFMTERNSYPVAVDPDAGAVTARQLLRESHVVAAVGGAP
jgi:glycosyltransferase involved in cell wall biosynthesis